MHYDVDYTKLADEEKRQKAMQDIKGYLGDTFEKVEKTMKQAKTFEEFSFYAAFVGVQGYPVKVWFEELQKTE